MGSFYPLKTCLKIKSVNKVFGHISLPRINLRVFLSIFFRYPYTIDFFHYGVAFLIGDTLIILFASTFSLLQLKINILITNF